MTSEQAAWEISAAFLATLAGLTGRPLRIIPAAACAILAWRSRQRRGR